MILIIWHSVTNVSKEYYLCVSVSSDTLIVVYQTKRLYTKNVAVSSSILSEFKVQFYEMLSPTTLLDCELCGISIVLKLQLSMTSVLMDSRLVGSSLVIST